MTDPARTAHDLNNALSALVTNLELAVRDVETAIAVHGESEVLVALREELRDARRGADRVRDLAVVTGGEVAPPVPVVSAVPARRRGRILVIDDEPMIGRLVQRSLATEHDVTVIHHPLDALDHITGGARFDLVFCDLQMPEVGGIELHAELVRRAPDQAGSIVFLTGGAPGAEARAALDRIGLPRIEKPFDVGALRALVAARLRQ